MMPLTKQTLMLVIALIATVWFLDWLAPVAIPIVSALFLVAVFWPLQKKLQGSVGKAWAALVSLLAMALVLSAFVGAIVAAGDYALDVWQNNYQQTFMQQVETMRKQLPDVVQLPQGGGTAQGWLQSLGKSTFETLSLLLLTLALAVLALAEVSDTRRNMKRELGDGSAGRWLEIGRRGSREFRLYVLVRTGIGLLTGALVWLFCWAVGLDLAIVWGLMNFLLNYIPTIGSIIGVIPPALFALVQFGLSGKALAVAGGVAAIQLIMGNYVDPLLQGKYLQLSTTVVLISITLWGWMWGPIGALLGVPITLILVTIFDEFRQTRWLSVLLTRGRRRDEKGD